MVREKFQTITSRFASYQAQWLNVHGDFPHCLADFHRLGALSRHQDPRDAHHPADGSGLAEDHRFDLRRFEVGRKREAVRTSANDGDLASIIPSAHDVSVP